MRLSRGTRHRWRDRPGLVSGVILLVLAPASGCGSPDPVDGLRSELEANWARWVAERPTQYAYTVERLCFCGPEARGPVVVSVEGATVTGRVYVSSSDPVPAALEGLYPSVDGLFEFVEDAMDRDAYRIEVTYDSSSGIPLDVWVDYQQNVADEEVGFAVRSLPATG